jgi:hypothetical protein
MTCGSVVGGGSALAIPQAMHIPTTANSIKTLMIFFMTSPFRGPLGITD